MLLSSCEKLPLNGQLDGMWQLMKIQRNGQESENTQEDRLYYSFQLNLMALQKGGQIGYLGRFAHNLDSLTIYDFRQQSDNSVLASTSDLFPFGLNSTTEYFLIERLDNASLIIHSESVLLTFRRF